MNTKLPFFSNRFYAIAFIEGESINTHLESFADLCEDNGHEYRYAIQQNIDKVLDLKVGERLLIEFNRDNKDSSGFIRRINCPVS